MKYLLLLIAFGLLSCTLTVNSASIYKCTRQDKSVVFTDKPCPSESEGQVFYTETATDLKRKELVQKTATIKKLIENNQMDAAKEYAEKNQVLEIYQTQIAAHLKSKEEEEKQKTEAEKQQKNLLDLQNANFQKQQLELQKQQVEIDKAKLEEQKKTSNFPNYIYPYYTLPCKGVYRPYGCTNPPPPPLPKPPPPPPGKMNPPSAPFLPPMNPPSNGGLNPP